jgi:hypothetical protein
MPDDSGMPPQGNPATYRCHGCNATKRILRGVKVCPICDYPPATTEDDDAAR